MIYTIGRCDGLILGGLEFEQSGWLDGWTMEHSIDMDILG